MSEFIRIALVGCGKTKAVIKEPSGYIEAGKLYTGDLFRKRVEHVEGRKLPWYILSAKGGLLNPLVMVRTYDQTMDQLNEIEQAEWHLGVANQLMTELYYAFNSPKLKNVVVELHAGSTYCEPLGRILQLFGITVEKPVANLGIGQQLKYYSQEPIGAGK